MKEYKEFAENIAREAGKIMKEYFAIGAVRTYKEDSSPVTEADTKINSLLIQQVLKKFPTHSIQGEEESHFVEKSEYLWVCDPIDGTQPFTLGMPISVFSLALVKDGEVILGVIYDPFCDRMYSAEKGKGAYLNGTKLEVSKTSTLENIIAEHEIFNIGKYNIEPLVDELRKRKVKFMELRSFIYPSALVAAGQLGFTLFPHTTNHDVASIKILVEEAGGKVTDMYGNEQRYDRPLNGAIVSNGVVHDELVALAKKFTTLQ